MKMFLKAKFINNSKKIFQGVFVANAISFLANIGLSRIYNPEDGKSYKSKIRVLDSGNLEVKGCITLICRKTGEWLPLRVEFNEDGKRVASLANPLAIF